MQFSFTSRVIANALLRFDWLSLSVSFVLILFGAFCDLSTNGDPFLMFNLACSERMIITYCSSYTSSVVAFSTGFLLKKSVNFRSLPAMRCIAISKFCAILLVAPVF